MVTGALALVGYVSSIALANWAVETFGVVPIDGGLAAISDGKAAGLYVHVGMVNGEAFLRHVVAAGADSADGTAMPRNPGKNVPLLLGMLDRLTSDPPALPPPASYQLSLPLEAS